MGHEKAWKFFAFLRVLFSKFFREDQKALNERRSKSVHLEEEEEKSLRKSDRKKSSSVELNKENRKKHKTKKSAKSQIRKKHPAKKVSFQENPEEIPDIIIELLEDNSIADTEFSESESSYLPLSEDETSISESLNDNLAFPKFDQQKLTSPKLTRKSAIKSPTPKSEQDSEFRGTRRKNRSGSQIIEQIETILDEMSDNPEIPLDAPATDVNPGDDADKPRKNQKPAEPPITFRDLNVINPLNYTLMSR